MRERLAAAFILLAVSVLVLAGLVRAWSLNDLVRDQEVGHLRDDARLIAALVAEERSSGGEVDEEMLDGLVRSDAMVEYDDGQGGEVVVTGSEFDEDADLLIARMESGSGTVTLSSGARRAADVFAGELTALVLLVLLVSLLAGLAGWVAARWLSEPFRALAEAAASLGRGRFDVQVPDTRIPEARAIGQALRVTAAQMEGRLSRERDFAEFASHELRTPLTSLRMELEDLTVRADVPGDVKEAAGRCVKRVDAVNRAAGEVVALSRQGALIEGGQLMLGELATQITQTWSDRLAPERRTVTARAEGEIDLMFTPGPVEQILEVVLEEVVRGEGPVQLTFQGSPTHVRVVVPAGIAGAGPIRCLETARGLALPQGGRISGDLLTTDLDLWMPRR